ncbi:MAG: hypothetical protein IIB09_09185 [Bacteroidetes bacterium]|nr:hypothetical protein [Bacteroidota bacterium]
MLDRAKEISVVLQASDPPMSREKDDRRMQVGDGYLRPEDRPELPQVLVHVFLID